MTLHSIRCADAVRYMSVNVDIQPLRCTDSHGHRPSERVDLPKLQTCPVKPGGLKEIVVGLPGQAREEIQPQPAACAFSARWRDVRSASDPPAPPAPTAVKSIGLTNGHEEGSVPPRLSLVPELSEEELDALVEEATVDAYNDEEQLGGFAVMIEDNLEMPFETTVLGVMVTVNGVTQTESGIVADCVRDGQHQAISVLDLPLPEPPPKGAEWIAAYRHWARHA